MSELNPPQGLRAEIGLCSICRWARSSANTRGSVFWRCARADRDATLRRYPPLPVKSCHGLEPLTPRAEPAS